MSKRSMFLGMDREVVVLGMSKQGMRMELFTKFHLLFAVILGRQDQKTMVLDMNKKMTVFYRDREVVVLGMNIDMMALDMSKEMVVLDRWNTEH